MRTLPTLAAALLLTASAIGAEEPARALNPLSTMDAGSALKSFRERPLFSPSRRGPQPAPVVEAAPEPDPEPEPQQIASAPPEPNLKLTGVVEAADDAVAIVQDLSANATWRLRLGDTVGGWLVTAIEPIALRLTYGEDEKEYRLFEPPASAGSPGEAGEGGDLGGEAAQGSSDGEGADGGGSEPDAESAEAPTPVKPGPKSRRPPGAALLPPESSVNPD